MATLLSALAHAGSRKSDGSVNASGLVYLYQAGTLTQEIGYADAEATAPIATVSGGAIALDAAGKRTIFTKAPCDVVIATAAGTIVDSIAGANRWRAELVEVVHAGFTGALTDPGTGAVSQALGGVTDFQTLLTRARASLGPDFQYQESSGAVPRNHLDWMREVWISVKDMGAAGDGLVVDTTAIQKAIDRVSALRGGIVYFPPGTYIIDQALTCNTSGVSFRGAGSNATFIKSNNSLANGLTITGATGFTIEALAVTHATASTGIAISLSACKRFTLSDVANGTSLWRTGVSIGGAATVDSLLLGCVLSSDGNAAARAVIYNTTGISPRHHITGCYLLDGGVGSCVEYAGSVGSASIADSSFVTTGAGNGVVFNAALTGINFAVTNCPSLSYDVNGSAFSILTAADPGLRQQFNGIDGYTVDVATGGNHTPNRARGREITIRAITGAGTVTVNAPTPPPPNTMRDVRLTIKFVNAAGGAVTWAFAAATFLFAGAAVPANTDLHTIVVDFLWDANVSKWREVCRADSLT